MLVLDTDLLSIVSIPKWGHLPPIGRTAAKRISSTKTVAGYHREFRRTDARLVVLISNRGVRQKKDERSLINGYDRLHELLKDFEIRTVLDFDEGRL